MNGVPALLRVFGPGLLGTAALGLVTLFNAVDSDLGRLRKDVAALQEQRAEYTTAADLRAVADDFDHLIPPEPATPPASPTPAGHVALAY